MAFDENNAAWANEFKELYVTLSPEEYRAAKESTLTAFYTPPVVIKAMYDALDRLGFSEGNIWSRPAVQAISLVCFPTVWQNQSSTV